MRSLTLLVLLAGCAPDSGGGGVPDAAPEVADAEVADAHGDLGAVRIFWSLDHGNRTCEQVGAVTVEASLTRQSDGVSASASIPCEDLMGTVSAVPRPGDYVVHFELMKGDGTSLGAHEEALTFADCDTTITTDMGTLCGKELAPFDFDVP